MAGEMEGDGEEGVLPLCFLQSAGPGPPSFAVQTFRSGWRLGAPEAGGELGLRSGLAVGRSGVAVGMCFDWV
jgi:hypothetical protein